MSSAQHFKDIRMIPSILQAKKEKRRKLSRHLAMIDDVARFKIFVIFPVWNALHLIFLFFFLPENFFKSYFMFSFSPKASGIRMDFL